MSSYVSKDVTIEKIVKMKKKKKDWSLAYLVWAFLAEDILAPVFQLKTRRSGFWQLSSSLSLLT